MDGVEVKHHQKKLRALVCSLNSGEAAYSHMFFFYITELALTGRYNSKAKSPPAPMTHSLNAILPQLPSCICN